MSRVGWFGVVGWLLLVASAPAATVTSVSVFSEPGDYVGDNRSRVFTAGDAQINTRAYDGEVDVDVWPAADEWFTIALGAPRGETLGPHNYVGATRTPFREDAEPGIDVSGGGRGCNETWGRFEVRQIQFAADGSLARFWALWQQHCEGGEQAAHGEVRINAWVPETARFVTPGIIRWPPVDSWRPAGPARVVYSGSAPITSVAVGGAQAGDFTVTDDGCTGHAGPCAVELRFVPGAPGPRTGTLTLTDTGGGQHQVRLEGFLHGGTTHARFEILPGDAGNVPGVHEYGPGNAHFRSASHGAGRLIGLDVIHDNYDYWYADLWNGGNAVVPGTYDPAPPGTYGPGPEMRAYGSQSLCNQTGGAYTVKSLSFLPDGQPRSFDVELEKRCYDDQRPAMRASWQFHQGADEQLPDWLVPGAREGAPAPALAPDTGSAPVAPSSGAPAPAPAPSGGGTAPAGRSGLLGRWIGKLAVARPGKRPARFPIVLRVTALRVGHAGGSVRYPATPCHGRLVVLSHTDKRATFRYRERWESKGCTGNDRVKVRLAAGRLHVRVIPPNPAKPPGTGTLARG